MVIERLCDSISILPSSISLPSRSRSFSASSLVFPSAVLLFLDQLLELFAIDFLAVCGKRRGVADL